MIRNSIICSIRVGAVATAIVFAMGALGCGGSDNGDDEPNKAGKGGDESGSGGTSGESKGNEYQPATERCPYENPPLEDPFCLNEACPLADLSTITDANKPMGDCCNTVDVERLEASMAEGEKHDLELVWYTNLPKTQPAIANPLIEGLMLGLQESGGDIILMRLHDVPRTADMKEGESVPVTLEIGTGKLNCDGTFSFYGPNAAREPLENTEGKVPNDPGRWESSTLEIQYNGFNAEELFEKPSPEAIANATQLNLAPRWNEEGLTYEQPLKFLMVVLKNNPGNWSCFGSISRDGEWDKTQKLMPFVPMEEAKYAKIEDLGFQSQCGLFTLEAYKGDCDEVPREEWTYFPTGYCDDNYMCWIGDPTDAEYPDFWTELYPGEDGCGEAHPCCDPMGLDASMEPCNAFYMREVGVVAAVEITDEPINDPSQAASYRTLCEGGE